MTSRPRSSARRFGAVAAVVASLAMMAGGTVHAAAPTGTAPTGGAGAGAPGAEATGRTPDGAFTVTLVTGDRVTAIPTRNGKYAVTIAKVRGREHIPYVIRTRGSQLSVIPADALKLIAQNRLDARLFDLALLKKWKYDDAHTSELPLLVSGAGGGAGLKAALPASRVARSVPTLGLTSVRTQKSGTAGLWSRFTAGSRSKKPAITKLWLVGKMTPSLDATVRQIGAPGVWAAGHTGRGATVAVLDSGVDANHPDLRGVVVRTKDFTGSATGAADQDGHGTHVAGIIAGRGTASKGRYTGVAKAAHLVVGKVCEEFCPEDAILQGMAWAATSGAKVINMSLGGPAAETGDPFEAAVETLTARHRVLFVVAAGNDGRAETINSPGTADSALTVGSVEKGTDELSDTSSQGPRLRPSRRLDYGIKPDITAPGGNVLSARAGGRGAEAYVSISGTSMAAPHVAGAAAILAVRHPRWTPQQLKAALMSTANFRPGQTVYQQGAGRLDLARASRQQVTATGSVNLGYFPWPSSNDPAAVRKVTYTNFGTAPVTLKLGLKMTDDKGKPAAAGMFALSTNAVTVKAGGTAAVTVTVRPIAGTRGLYGGTLSAGTADGRIKVQTAVGAYKEPESYNVSYQQFSTGTADTVTEMLLYNVKTGDAYGEAFQGAGTKRLPAGQYMVFATTMDNASTDRWTTTLEVRSLTVNKPVEMVLDARKGKPVRFAVDRPVGATATAGSALLALYQNASQGAYASDGNLFAVPTTAGTPKLTYAATATLVKRGSVLPGSPGSPFTYNLSLAGTGPLPAGRTFTVRAADLATVRQTIHRESPHEVRTLSHGGISAISDISSSPLVELGGVTQRTDYFTTVPEAGFDTLFTSGSRGPNGAPTIDWVSIPAETAREFTKGFVGRERWNAATFSPRFDSPRGGIAQRLANRFSIDVPMRADADGHFGSVSWQDKVGSDLGHASLARNGVSIWSGPIVSGGLLVGGLPPALATYRLRMTHQRTVAWAHLSRRIEADWTFKSKFAEGDDLPLLTVRYLPQLDTSNRAAAGNSSLRLKVEGVDHSVPVSVRKLAVEVSYDGGKTWSATALTGSGANRQAAVRNPAGGSVSLRATASDAAGNSVRQTVITAYKVR